MRRLAGGDVEPVVPMLLVGDGVHNFIDGVVLFVAWSTDPYVGAVTTVAVAVHEVAQEVGDLGALVSGGLELRRALVLNLGSALLAVVGVLVAAGLSSVVDGAQAVLLPLAAGNFLYTAAADLVSSLHEERRPSAAWLQVVIVTAGVGVMAAIRLVRQGLS